MEPTVIDVNLSDVIFDETIYPRSKHNHVKVQEYAEHINAIESQGNYISVDAQLRLLDGRHRHLAYEKLSDGKERAIKAYQYPDNIDSRLMSIRLNSTHGQQLSSEDKRRNCIALYSSGYTLETIQNELSVSYSFAQKATKGQRDEAEKQLNERVRELWMRCYTQTEIAGSVDLPQSRIAEKLETFIGIIQKNNSDKSLAFFEDQDFQKPLYNIWSFAKKTNTTAHFGNSEQRILENLLYLYTQPFDIVLDPFAGGGSTIDVCLKRLRRYWVSDRKPIVEREDEIRKLDIAKELPTLNRNWSEVSLTYLDPPYWRQAEGKYSESADDLANMPLEDFTKAMIDIVKRIASKQSKGAIALLIQPTQWKSDNREFTDHVFDIIKGVNSKNLTLENRVSCPYSTEQYNAQQVEWAKEHRKLLVISRELIIWRVG